MLSRPTLVLLSLLSAGIASTKAAPRLAWLEFESIMPVRTTSLNNQASSTPPLSPTPAVTADTVRAVPVTWVMAYPDTIAKTDTRALLSSLAPGKGQTLLPKGRLTRVEEDFLEGLRAFMDNDPPRTAEAWSRLRGKNLPPALLASMRVNLAVMLALRGDAKTAEGAWLKEWNDRTVAADGAWRNILTVRMAEGRWRDADAAINVMLATEPRHRVALLARAALLWQLRPESEWVGFLKTRADEDSAVPDLQLAYGEYLLRRGRPGDVSQAVLYFDKGLEKLPKAGRGWYLLADAQFRQGYYYFALDCLQNAGRAGYAGADFHELYARVLHTCCTGDEDPRAPAARKSAQELLEKGLVKDLHRRSAAQLLYTLYAQNLKPDAAKELERNLWFHFEGPRRDVRKLGTWAWGERGLDDRELKVRFGLYDLNWILALREKDVYRAW
jgi:tetratricopeptide (TPR) repeat protein